MRKAIIAILTASAAVVLALIILNWRSAPLITPRHGKSIYDVPTFAPPVDLWPGRRHSLHISAARGRLRIERNSNYCLSCGLLAPGHTSSCIPSVALVSYGWPPSVENRIAVPGLEWKTWVFFGVRHNKLTISLWLLLATFAVYPGAAFIRGPLRRRRRRRSGRCQRCGYDLTGNVSGRCPECGAEQS